MMYKTIQEWVEHRDVPLNNKSNNSGDSLEYGAAELLNEKLPQSTLDIKNTKGRRAKSAFSNLQLSEQIKVKNVIDNNIDAIIKSENLTSYSKLTIMLNPQSNKKDDQRDILVLDENGDVVCGISCKRNNGSNKSITWNATTGFKRFINRHTGTVLPITIDDIDKILDCYNQSIKYIHHVSDIFNTKKGKTEKRWPNSKQLKRPLTPRECVVLRNRRINYDTMICIIYEVISRYDDIVACDQNVARNRLYKSLCGIGDYDFYKLDIIRNNSELIVYNTNNSLKNVLGIKEIEKMPATMIVELKRTKNKLPQIHFIFDNGVKKYMRLHNNSGNMKCPDIAIECMSLPK